MAKKISRAAIHEVLSNYVPSGFGSSLLAMKAVSSAELEGGRVLLALRLPESYKGDWPAIQAELAERISAIESIEGVSVNVEWEPSPESKKPNLLPFVKNVVVVGSGKGGVGKSTVAANLACSLAARGHAVGLLDADLHGPSMGMMFGVGGDDGPIVSPRGMIEPVEKYGLKIMSMGFLIEEERPVIWRGPMLHKALEQFMAEVEWGALDILLIDLPPGTGDILISIVNSVRVGGAVVVSTPQDVAFLDAKKAIAMFSEANIPILGVIENMSSFVCPKCGEETQIFGSGGVRRAAQAMGLPFLGEIPIDLQIRMTCDQGAPIAAINPDGPQARVFGEIAAGVWGKTH
ncbi:MAG: Mrp/NBP35 family ATP-binding protein [Holophagales bacterium]|nr:Mrp/NBP35 family ATP-binding protein [Holophagales bacterium]